eukprot:CAMPEP_0184434808 /NCGR_PEP_ID=MMETSP0738-20130409/460182_1 /TAXON_ID=385413 /ORGANISM="Thalassiosira miniscula, Strain CCMP1093" /LENGTH=92 /DNA_ID=CAMNT_0026800979 /DNA_START=1 /DNA_END=276 /DNA_ORIENTATION=-
MAGALCRRSLSATPMSAAVMTFTRLSAQQAGRFVGLLMQAALIQLNVSDTPARNLAGTVKMVRDAAAQGAAFILTPEVTNCVSTSRDHQRSV